MWQRSEQGERPWLDPGLGREEPTEDTLAGAKPSEDQEQATDIYRRSNLDFEEKHKKDIASWRTTKREAHVQAATTLGIAQRAPVEQI